MIFASQNHGLPSWCRSQNIEILASRTLSVIDPAKKWRYLIFRAVSLAQSRLWGSILPAQNINYRHVLAGSITESVSTRKFRHSGTGITRVDHDFVIQKSRMYSAIEVYVTKVTIDFSQITTWTPSWGGSGNGLLSITVSINYPPWCQSQPLVRHGSAVSQSPNSVGVQCSVEHAYVPISCHSKWA